MRLAVVSDIHGNRRAFDAVLSDLDKMSPDAVVHGGDLAANGRSPSEIVEEVRSRGWQGVRGNTDEMLCVPDTLSDVAARHPRLSPILTAFKEIIPATVACLSGDQLRWLNALPVRLAVGDVTILHATQADLWRAPLNTASNEDLKAAFADFEPGIVIYGHIHRPYVRTIDRLTVANTGSVSLSYDGDQRASYLLVDHAQVSIRRIEYDWEDEAFDLERSGLPHAGWLGRMLRSGRYQPPATSCSSFQQARFRDESIV